MYYKSLVLGVILVGSLILTCDADALILINEILADPPPGILGDANNDGTRSSNEDEFIEIFNSSTDSMNLSGWYLTDLSMTRHIFDPDFIILPDEIIVVFGGGTPNLVGINWLTASSGGLSLNNGGDTITLFDSYGQMADQLVYGSEGGDNQSLTRFPEGENSDFIKHLSHPNAEGRPYSAGYFVGQDGGVSIPEPASLYYVSLIFGAVLLLKRE